MDSRFQASARDKGKLGTLVIREHERMEEEGEEDEELVASEYGQVKYRDQ